MLGPLTALASCLARSGHAQAAAPFIALAGVRWGPSTWRRPYTTTHVTLDSIMVVPMPSLSHAMTHGTISKWHKAAGDKVHMYDILLEVGGTSSSVPVTKQQHLACPFLELHERLFNAGALHQAALLSHSLHSVPASRVCHT
jgi:hypothetical protein